ncbi:Sequence orphan [Colletotrichum higginsianum IMI 349063]|uniref:Sequence orphan n=1 Tax=Colletotrichum higginsianum (strain IMI 349063) TaxID=759273 RepID=A0A1B7XUR0_COLHI|nr:Sequence orphan [Colletotrichum higginsianum IMI 349063]OBR03478.1 Sequence orphan [Colletotrichum higginsianum IMI 349063]
MMRICFRIGEMLNAFTKCARERQDVVLELFARWLGSVVDGHSSVVDGHSSAFLGPSGKNKLCRCVCRLSYDSKAAIGRTASILSIRETDWDEIQWALRMVARDAASDGGGSCEEGMLSSGI